MNTWLEVHLSQCENGTEIYSKEVICLVKIL